MYEIDSTERIFTPSPIGQFETPSPADDGEPETPAPVEVVAEGNYVGCFLDTKDERIMTKAETASPMSSLVSTAPNIYPLCQMSCCVLRGFGKGIKSIVFGGRIEE